MALGQDDNAVMVAMQRQMDALKAQFEPEIKRLREYVNRRLKGFSKKLKEQKGKQLFFEDIMWVEDGPETSTLQDCSDTLFDLFEGLEKMIDDFSVWDLAENVVCPNCNEKGYVSLQIKCNACGVRTGMGWHPS